jgi:hypothetical protein
MKNKKAAPLMYRQGDVLIVRVDSIPSDATPLAPTKRGVVLAEGEVTGHVHRIPSRHAKLYRTEGDAKFLRIGAGGKRPVALVHEEHRAVELPPGNYRISIHREYEPGAFPRQVAD